MKPQRKHRLPALFTVTVCLVILALLAHFQVTPLQVVDHWLAYPLQTKVTPTRTFMFRLISVIAQPTFALIYAVLLTGGLWYFHQRAAAVWSGTTFLAGAVISWLLKHLVARPRPTTHILTSETGYSFPSGHVFTAVMIISLLLYLFTKSLPHLWQRAGCLLLAGIWLGLVLCARIYLGAHYPSDTVAGLLLGYLWLRAALWSHHQFNPWLQTHLEKAPTTMRHARKPK